MKTNTKTNQKSTAVKPARKPKAVKPVGTVTELMAAVAELIASGSKIFTKSRTQVRIDELSKGSGRVTDNYWGNAIYFSSYADGATQIRAQVAKEKADAEAQALKSKTLTKVQAVAGYTAEVSSLGIVLGCKTVTFEKFAEVAKAVEKVKGIVAAEKAKTAKTAKKATAKK